MLDATRFTCATRKRAPTCSRQRDHKEADRRDRSSYTRPPLTQGIYNALSIIRMNLTTILPWSSFGGFSADGAKLAISAGAQAKDSRLENGLAGPLRDQRLGRRTLLVVLRTCTCTPSCFSPRNALEARKMRIAVTGCWSKGSMTSYFREHVGNVEGAEFATCFEGNKRRLLHSYRSAESPTRGDC